MLEGMTPLRSDAARSRERILAAAADRDRAGLRLNDVARAAGVGVGTVYRHFPTVGALVEALAAGTVQRALDAARASLQAGDAGVAFDDFLTTMLDLMLGDDGLQHVLLAAGGTSTEAGAAKEELVRSAATLLHRAQQAGAVRAEVTLDQLMHLVCGIEHAVRLGTPRDRGTITAVLLAGLRPD